MTGALIQIIFDIINSQPTYGLQIDRHIPITLGEVMQSLILIFLPRTQGSQPRQQTTIRVILARQYLVPLHRLFRAIDP